MGKQVFLTSDAYEEHKEEDNLCYVKGCSQEQEDDCLCEQHLADRESGLHHECDLCHIPVPGISNFCEFHGGVSYTEGMKSRLLDAIQPRDESFIGQLKDEAKEVLPQIALEAFVKNTRAGLSILLKRMNVDSETFDKIIKFIDSDLGSILYTVLLAGGMSLLPKDIAGLDTENLSSQLRKHAMKNLGTSVTDLFIPALGIVLNQLATNNNEPASKAPAQLEHVNVPTVTTLLQEQNVEATINVR